MVQIQVNLDKEENRLVNMYKAEHDIATKEDTIRIIIRTYLGDD